jgi:2-polyprenyl-3-methyl-5-hydroxy-6-metoxy-1,4-benzoquinol methylase
LRKLREPSAARTTRANTKSAYERLYGSTELLADYLRPSRLAFYDEVAAVCAAFSPRSLIDVGCGSGQLVNAIAQRVENLERAVGVDYTNNAVARARESFPSFEWRVGDLYDLDREFASCFDLVVCTEVLEHLDRPREAVDRLVRLRSPDGKLVLTVPDGAIDDWAGHANFWTENELFEFLAPFGRPEIRRIDEGRTLLAITPFE